MRRIIVHNHVVRGASLGQFRATAAVRDHKDCGCGCGGHGDCNKAHDDYAKAEMGIDVTYVKGGYGRSKITERRAYTVPNVLVDPRGNPPSGPFVAQHLRAQPEHQRMVKEGWTAEKAEGYYKREQRDVGERV